MTFSDPWNTFNPKNIRESCEGTSHVLYKSVIWTLSILTIFVLIFIWIKTPCNSLSGVVTFLLLAGASAAGGAAIGFLFGLPRANKFRMIQNSTDSNDREFSYGDNTNLEEVSDWLTKIIVGLTLIKVNTILGWIDTSAMNFDNVFNHGCKAVPINMYVVGYCSIVLYFLAGAGLCYLWARTNLSLILTRSRASINEIEKRQLMTQVQTLANEALKPSDGVVTFLSENVSPDLRNQNYPTEKFRNTIEKIYNAKKTFDKTDLQRNRWGGKNKVNNYVLKAAYVANASIPDLFVVKLTVHAENPDSPLTGEVAFFVHDTFPSEVIYTVAFNNLAEITLAVYEAFVAGARLEDGTELEIDLNKVEGFPKSFYWRE